MFYFYCSYLFNVFSIQIFIERKKFSELYILSQMDGINMPEIITNYKYNHSTFFLKKRQNGFLYHIIAERGKNIVSF